MRLPGLLGGTRKPPDSAQYVGPAQPEWALWSSKNRSGLPFEGEVLVHLDLHCHVIRVGGLLFLMHGGTWNDLRPSNQKKIGRFIAPSSVFSYKCRSHSMMVTPTALQLRMAVGGQDMGQFFVDYRMFFYIRGGNYRAKSPTVQFRRAGDVFLSCGWLRFGGSFFRISRFDSRSTRRSTITAGP